MLQCVSNSGAPTQITAIEPGPAFAIIGTFGAIGAVVGGVIGAFQGNLGNGLLLGGVVGLGAGAFGAAAA